MVQLSSRVVQYLKALLLRAKSKATTKTKSKAFILNISYYSACNTAPLVEIDWLRRNTNKQGQQLMLNVLKNVLKASILLTACLATSGCPAATPAERLKDAAVTLSRPNGQIFCTGVAVGRHTIMTNNHCLRGETVILYNGKACPTDKLVAFDGTDNVLVRTCQRFKHYRHIRHVPLHVGDRVSHYGHPYGLPMMYREGVLILRGEGVDFRMPAGKIYMFDMNATGGDSGGPIYDMYGRIACTTSFGIHAPGDGFTVTACYLPQFTKQQLEEIK